MTVERSCVFERRTKRYLQNQRFISLLFFLLIGIWTLPSPLKYPTQGLGPSWIGPSWMIGLIWAAQNNYQFGTDILFQYGPLGLLLNRTYVDYNLWLLSLIYALFVHFLFIVSLMLFTIKLSPKWYCYPIFLLIILIPMQASSLDYKLVISLIIILYLMAIKKIHQKYVIYTLIILCSFLLASASLIKFTMIMVSVATLLTFSIISILNKNNKNKEVKATTLPVCSLIMYLVFIVVLWILAKQNTSILPIYLIRSFWISNGYNDAMSINGPAEQVFLGFVSILFVLFLFVYYLIKKKNDLFTYVTLNMPLLLTAFKHGFIRHDNHVVIFFSTYSIFFGLLFVTIVGKEDLISRFNKKIILTMLNVLKLIPLLLSIILIISLCLQFPGIIKENVLRKYPAYESSASLIINSSYREQVIDTSKKRIQNYYSLNDTIVSYITNKTIDIFPWDVALVWAYDFNWSPRPVFLSCSAYTQNLDKLNERHFVGNEMPQAILYAYKSIDGRYPIFDEPSTFRSVLCNYDYSQKSREFVVLTKNPNAKNCGFEEYLETIEAEIGQAIPIPKYYSGYVFGYIELEYNLIGKIMKIIYKPSIAYIRFKFNDGKYSKRFRFIPDVAKNGVFLSQYVGSINDLAFIFNGSITNDIDAIIIEVDNLVQYNNYINVKFTGIPAEVSIKDG